MHIAAYTMATEQTIPALRRLRDAIDAKSKQWADVVKIGRTHLEDAMPLTVGQEWSGYAGALRRRDRRGRARHRRAAGAGHGRHRGRHRAERPARVRRARSRRRSPQLTGAPFVTAANKFTAQGTLDRMVRAHGGAEGGGRHACSRSPTTCAGSAPGPRTGLRRADPARPTSPAPRSCRARSTRPRPRRC